MPERLGGAQDLGQRAAGDRRPSSCCVSGSSAATTDGSKPDACDVGAGGREVLGRRQLQGAAVQKRRDRLHGGLAERALADERGPVVVDQGAGDDLGGARAAAVDEDDQRECRAAWRRRSRGTRASSCVQPVGATDDAVLDEDRGHVDRLREEAARVVAQVDDRARSRPAATSSRGGLLDALGRSGREREDADVAELLLLRPSRRALIGGTSISRRTTDELERLLLPGG